MCQMTITCSLSVVCDSHSFVKDNKFYHGPLNFTRDTPMPPSQVEYNYFPYCRKLGQAFVGIWPNFSHVDMVLYQCCAGVWSGENL